MKIDKDSTARALIPFATPPHLVILEARFYTQIADNMAAGAIAVAEAHGATVERIDVPGALELPAALQMMSQRRGRKVNEAFVLLGCVIRGGTTHYEIVCNESNRGAMDVALKHNLAIGNGILTVENLAQAEERADPAQLDKGGDAAYAALKVLALRQKCEAL